MSPRDGRRPPRGERPAGEHEVRGVRFRDEAAAAGERGPLLTAEPEPPAPAARPPRRITWKKVVTVPAVLAAVLLATWLWFRGTDLDSIAHQAVDGGKVWLALRQHLQLTAVSTFFVLVIALPLGVALTRAGLRRAAPAAVAAANLGQAVPALGLLVLLVIWLGIGPEAAVIGMVLYAVLPVLANTIAGLKAIDPTLTEAARGIGMSAAGVLGRVELPLAVPLILAGVRNALVLNVGTATLATFGGGGGLGDLISAGIITQRMPVLVLGSVLTVVLALLVDWLASLVELLLRPRGLEVGEE
ncbi:ABC transporter permease [Streptomyces albofaciens JCM 4342]|uniref:ABC transporter permease n=1 Tax=Streptomyces albofaciens TaxID=66866 RepID=UPI00123841C3|nr:ABC transporter permease [Streptomyces albofaciens]KAA6221613.1 ABC transporter permease [Streptomyces albofaciens JCM 4342]